jgi:F-type H+-transporting ATPase subunit delta
MTRYAKALLTLAREQGAEEAVGTELSQVVNVLTAPALAQTLAVPNLSLRVRKTIVEQLVSALAPQPLLGNFLQVLAENDRLKDLPEIGRAYQHLLERMLGRMRAKIRSAAPLSEDELTELVEAFSRLMQKTVIPVVEVDPELLGGVLIEVEGRVYDASLKTQLENMGEILARQL